MQEAEESDDIGWDEIDVDQIKLPGQEPEPEPIAEEESPNEPEEKAEEEKPAEPARETKKEVSPEVKVRSRVSSIHGLSLLQASAILQQSAFTLEREHEPCKSERVLPSITVTIA